jgi:VCBS repeat-containing protein
VSAERDVPAGDKDDTVAVKLLIKPATLTITGDGNHQYSISDHQEVTARVGSNQVPMDRAFQPVTVTDVNTSATVTVQLSAGHEVQAVFSPAPPASGP